MAYELGIAQIRPRKADYAYNLERIGAVFAEVSAYDVPLDVLVFPETATSGYFLEGGVRELAQPAAVLFADLLKAYRASGAAQGSSLDVVVGFYELDGGRYYNSGLYATLTADDSASAEAGIRHVHRKFFIPTYGVFDEKRFVSRGRTIDAFPTRFGPAAILICEDLWHSIAPTVAALKGAQIIYVISASPGRDFSTSEVGNVARWKRMLPAVAEEHNVFVAYAGLVGFEGGKGFTGSSCIVDPWGRTMVQGDLLGECLVRGSVELADVDIARADSPLLADLESTVADLALDLQALSRRPYGGM